MRLGTLLLALALVAVVGPASTSAQSVLGTLLGPSVTSAVLESRWDSLEPGVTSGLSLDTHNQRLGLGPIDLGVQIAPRRLLVRLDPGGDRTPLAGSTSIYRLTDTELKTTDIGLDLRLRWPVAGLPDDNGWHQVQPYLALGPAVSVTQVDEASTAPRYSSRLDPSLSLGMRGALGLMWQVSKEAAFFGEYRMIQDRAFGRTAGEQDRGVDLSYGFSLRF